MRGGFRITLILGLCFASQAGLVHAVPSFARQTGLSCNVCHRNPPELTAFGRNFKLKGYSLSSMGANEKVGTATDLHLSKFMPVSAMILLSNTAFISNQPGTQNNASGFPQQASVFFAGSFASHFGGLAQITYTHANDHFSMDNTDLRFSNHSRLHGEDDDFGITANNNPTVEDLWNSTPAWGFPWISSAATVSPIASPVINGALAQDVAGVGAYNMWNNHLYTDVSVYRSEHAGAPAPIAGTGFDFNITGVAPYWRTAWQQNWDRNYLEVGSYGIYVNAYPNAVTGPTNRFADTAFDFQYARPIGTDELDAHGTYIHEKSNLGAALAAGGANIAQHHLNSFKLDAVYHWTNRYSATAAVFSTSGTADTVLYAPAALTGSNNGSPATNGYILQFAYWPVQNLDINLNYTGYRKFNGATTNYDGANRNASDNDSVYMAVWLSF
jgi:hypothetical protein